MTCQAFCDSFLHSLNFFAPTPPILEVIFVKKSQDGPAWNVGPEIFSRGDSKRESFAPWFLLGDLFFLSSRLCLTCL